MAQALFPGSFTTLFKPKFLMIWFLSFPPGLLCLSLMDEIEVMDVNLLSILSLTKLIFILVLISPQCPRGKHTSLLSFHGYPLTFVLDSILFYISSFFFKHRIM